MSKQEIIIQLEFWSDFQKELYEDMLHNMLLALELRLKDTHQGNDMEVERRYKTTKKPLN